MSPGPALVLATILGLGLTALVTQSHPIRAFNKMNPIHRRSQFNVLKSYLSHLGDKKPDAPVKAVVLKTGKKSTICDSTKTAKEQDIQGCLITADALEVHCNPNYQPGRPGQHQAHTWPGEGDPIGPDATRIQQWKNCDNLHSFNRAITGQSSLGQITADANSALQDVDPRLNVGNVGKVMPLINGSQNNRADDPPFDGRGSDPQILIPVPPTDNSQQAAPVYRVDPNKLGAKPVKQPPAPATKPQ